MTKMPIYLQILLTLLFICMTLPITGAYFISFCLLIWLCWSKNWTQEALVHPVSKAVAVWALSFCLAAVGSYFVSPYGVDLWPTLKKLSHAISKYYLLWIVIFSVFLHIRARSYDMQPVYKWFALWMVIYFVYMMTQRYTGIDWVHGFDAKIGPHQYSYGVYRFAGFMSHPLTLAYNLTLVTMLGCVFLLRNGFNRWWATVVGVCLVTLIFSGSRFPIIAFFLAIGICEIRRILKYKWWVLGGLALLVGGALVEGSLIGRFSELFDENRTLVERIPRLIFWKVHWQMFIDQPVFGVGIAGRGQAVIDYYTSMGQHDKMYTAHNVYLQTLADTGLVGLFGFCFLFLNLLKVGWKEIVTRIERPRFIGHLVVLVAISGILQNNLRDSEYVFAFWVCLALLICNIIDPQNIRESNESTGRKSPQNK